MVLLNAVSRRFRSIWNIGVTPDIRPEEVKHIRYTNIGAFILCVINIAAFIQGLADDRIAIIFPIANISVSALSLVVYALNMSGRYNAARIYLFLVFYALALFTYPLSGKEIVDHYFLFTPIAYSFLVFPREKKGSIALIIVLGFICYFAIMVLYQHVEPVFQLDKSSMALQNQFIIYSVILIFILGMMAAKYLVNKTEDSLAEERKKLAEMAEVLKALKLTGSSTLVTTASYDVNVYKSARNIDKVTVSPVAELNALCVLQPRRILVTKQALDTICGKSES